MTQTYFAGAALLPSGWAENVRLTVDEAGVLTAVTPNASSAGAEALVGCVVPGMANLHSHAFQRSLVGRTQRRGPDGDSFWTWREVMYQSLDRLGPEEVSAIAGWLAVELLEGAKAAVDLLASDEFVQDQLENHARNAAVAIRQVVVSESAQAAAAVAADVKRVASGKKR